MYPCCPSLSVDCRRTHPGKERRDPVPARDFELGGDQGRLARRHLGRGLDRRGRRELDLSGGALEFIAHELRI